MAIAASMLRSEMRRHLLMNVSLVASCVVGGTVVTNERGLFVPLGIHGMSETARAFAAMFTQSRLMAGEDMPNVSMASPLDPFEVTADSRDLRRRLMDAAGNFSEGAAEYNRELARIETQPLTTSELASAAPTGGAQAPAAASAAGPASTSSSSAADPGGSPLTGSNTSDVLPSTQQLSSPDVTPAQAAAATPTVTDPTPPPDTGVGAVPEPSSWAMLIAGFGMIGYFLRTGRRRRCEAAVEAAA